MKILKIAMVLCSGIISAQFGSLSIPINAGSKKEPGTIYKKDGSKEEGIVFLPQQWKDKTIKIKQDKKTSKINSEDIDSIVISPTDATKKFTFIYSPVREFKLFKKEYDEKPTKSLWLYKKIKGKMSLYYGGEMIGYKKDSIKVNRGDTFYYAQRKGENIPSLIGQDPNMLLSVNHNNVFRQMATLYFNDDEDMKAKIQSEKYTLKEIHKLAEDYNNKFKVSQKKKETLTQKSSELTEKPKSKSKTTKKTTKKK